MAFPSDEELLAIIEPAARRRGLDVEALRITRAGRKSVVGVRVDADDRPDLDLIEELSEEISTLLDAAEDRGDLNLGPGYQLEVSTPGVDQPLTAPRHWRRNRGRLVALTNAAGKQTFARIGALDAAEEQVVLIPVAGDGKDLRGKQAPEREVDIVALAGLAEGTTAVVQIEFSAPPQRQAHLSEMSFDQATSWRKDDK